MKKLLILRGVPGSGKSTYCEKLFEKGYRDIDIWSADQYFIRPDGTYDFNPRMLKNAHQWCQNGAEHSMTQNIFDEDGLGPATTVVIDNTNIKKQHYQVYLDMARKYGYEVEEIIVGEIDPDNDELIDLYFNRNKHGVPRETIKRMMKEFEF